MQKRIIRDSILYAHIQTKNHKWIQKQMKALGYTPTRGKSEFLDELLTRLRKKNPDQVRSI